LQRAGRGHGPLAAPSQHKEYVLVLLFVKYLLDKYAGQKDGLLDVPKCGSTADMVALKIVKQIGYKMNKIINRLAKANDLKGVIYAAEFNDPYIPVATYPNGPGSPNTTNLFVPCFTTKPRGLAWCSVARSPFTLARSLWKTSSPNPDVWKVCDYLFPDDQHDRTCESPEIHRC
jgi:hypothetical protein